MNVTVFRETRAILGESLVWDATGGGAMLWCDITAGLIHRSPLAAPADGSGDTVIALPAPVGSFHPCDLGGFIVSLGDRVVVVDAAGSITREVARIPHSREGLRLNEGKVDPAGRWVTGSMNLFDETPVGAFYAITGDGTVTVLEGGIGVANGLEWSADGARIWFTDTAAGTIYTGSYLHSTLRGHDAVGGRAEVRDVVAWHRGTMNDGLVLATDGTLWSSIYGGGVVEQYGPRGELLQRIALPAPNLTSGAFGGPDLGTLYVTSARENLSEEQLVDFPLSGSVFAIETGCRGFPPRPWRSGLGSTG